MTAAGNATSQARILAVLVEDGPLPLEKMAERLTLTHAETWRAAGRLVVRGYVERLERGVYGPTEDGAAALAAGESLASGPRGRMRKHRCPIRDTVRQRAWTAIRVLKRFTIADVVTAARRKGEADPSHNLGGYLRALVQAGVLAQSPFRADDRVPTSNGLKVYRLVRDMGATAPQWQRARAAILIHDTREVLPCSSTTSP